MKKFFKKIGRGLKKLGKGIMKIMSSKIGRIIGMVSLAFGVGSIFQAMYQGVAGGTAAGSAISGAATEVGKEAGIEAVAQGTVEAGKQEVLKTAGKEAARKSLDTTLEGVVTQTNNLKQAAGAVTGETVLATTSEGVAKAVANGGAEVATQGATFTPEVVSATTQQVGQQATQQTTSAAMDLQKNIIAGADGAGATATAGTEAGLTAVPDASKATESLLSPSPAMETFSDPTGIAGNYGIETKSLLGDPNVMETALQGDSTKSLTSQALEPAMEAQIAEFKAMKPSTLRDSLKNSETRQLYESLVEPSKGLTDANNISLELTPAGQVQGVQEFASFKEAYQAGNNPISGMGNVLGRAQTYDLGELTGGRLQGFAGEQGVFRTAQTASALLSPPEPVEMPSQNPYAAAEVATLSQIGATTAYQAPTMAMDFSNQMATGNVTNPFTTLNQIRQKAGFGNIYGSLNSMASMQVG